MGLVAGLNVSDVGRDLRKEKDGWYASLKAMNHPYKQSVQFIFIRG